VSNLKHAGFEIMEKKNTGQISGMAGESIYIVDG
jgi:hypothetical protein